MAALQDQIKSIQITVEAKLDILLQHWNLENKLSFLQRREEKSPRPVVLRKRRRHVKSTANWKMFSYQFAQNHAKADLIWDEKTRSEFRHALENEVQQFMHELEFVQSGTETSWNHTEFFVLELFSVVSHI
jgi:DnaJ family protein C protein 13